MILSFGAEAKVLAPPELVTSVCESLTNSQDPIPLTPAGSVLFFHCRLICHV